MSRDKGYIVEREIEHIKEQIREHIPLMEIARNLHIKYDTLIHHLKRLNINYNTNPGRKGIPHNEARKTVSYYIENNKTITSTHLRIKLIEEGIKERKCERCGATEWMGEELPLELHHLDGNHYNNNLNNLVILCSNCHAQMHGYNKTKIKEKHKSEKSKESNPIIREKREKKKYFCKHCGKEITRDAKTGLCPRCAQEAQRKVERPTKDVLSLLISTTPYVKIAKMFNVSDKAIIKWCKYYDIDYKTLHKTWRSQQETI